MPAGNVISAVRFLVVPYGRGSRSESQEACHHRDLMAAETSGLRLWLGRWLKSEDTYMRAYS